MIRMVQLTSQGLVAIVFLVAGGLNLAGMMADEMMHLGYPRYFSTVIGVGFIIGVICIYQSRFVFLQEWAFGAMAATLVGAAGTHILAGDPIGSAVPAVVTLIVLVIAYALRGQIRDRCSAHAG